MWIRARVRSIPVRPHRGPRRDNDTPIRRFAYNNAIGTWYPPDVTSLDDAAVIVWSDSRNAPDQDANTQDVYLRRMLPAGSDIPP